MNIISKLMTEFFTELVQFVNYFSIVTNFVLKSCRAKVSFVLMISSCGCGFVIWIN